MGSEKKRWNHFDRGREAEGGVITWPLTSMRPVNQSHLIHCQSNTYPQAPTYSCSARAAGSRAVSMLQAISIKIGLIGSTYLPTYLYLPTQVRSSSTQVAG